MPEGSFLYCDVSLPVPLDQPFTYSLPETLRHRVKAGSRILVPFGPRKLTGVILRCHDERPEVVTRDALRLLDSEPVLSAELLTLGRSPPDRLRVELAAPPRGAEPKLNKPERELRAFLELHPGTHNLRELEDMVRNASPAARSLARKGIVILKPEHAAIHTGPIRAR